MAENENGLQCLSHEHRLEKLEDAHHGLVQQVAGNSVKLDMLHSNISDKLDRVANKLDDVHECVNRHDKRLINLEITKNNVEKWKKLIIPTILTVLGSLVSLWLEQILRHH